MNNILLKNGNIIYILYIYMQYEAENFDIKYLTQKFGLIKWIEPAVDSKDNFVNFGLIILMLYLIY